MITLLIVLACLAFYGGMMFYSARRLSWHRYQQNLMHHSQWWAEESSMTEALFMAVVWPVTLPWAIFYHRFIRLPASERDEKTIYSFMLAPGDARAKREEKNDLKALEKRSATLEKAVEAQQRELDRLLSS